MKARSAAVAAVAASALALAGCSGDAGGGGDSLVWSMWIGSTQDQQAWESVASAGGEAAGLDVSLQGSPFADYWTKLSTQLGTSNAPCIVTMQSLRLNQFSDGLLPLDDLIESTDFDIDAFDAGALDALAIDGVHYAIPYDTGPLVLFYNRDAFAAAGVDEPEPGWTVDEFEAAADALDADGQMAFAASVEDLYIQSSVLAYNGGRVLAEDGAYDLTSPEFAEGVDWVAGLVQDGKATRADGADPSADDNAFMNGSAASMVAGPWQLIDIATKADFEVGVATIPAGASGQATFSAGSGFGISSTCEEPEAAFEAITAMTSEEVLGELAEQGRALPARTAQQPLWFDNAGIEGADASLESASASSVPLPGSALSDKFNQLLAQYGPQAVNGDRPAAEVLADMASQLGG